MKKKIYIGLFVLLGFLAQFLVHALVEIWYIKRLLADFEKYSLGFSWSDWFVIHYVGALVLAVLGVAVGWWGIGRAGFGGGLFMKRNNSATGSRRFAASVYRILC